MAAMGLVTPQAQGPRTGYHAGWTPPPYAAGGPPETLGLDNSPENHPPLGIPPYPHPQPTWLPQRTRHGFRAVHLNCWEHARLTNTPLYISSWDIRRAFDSVAKEAMDASWQRLGVPATTAHWIAHLDDQGPTAVRSPWALAGVVACGTRHIECTTPSKKQIYDRFVNRSPPV